MTQSTLKPDQPQDKRLILHAIHYIQDADSCLLGMPQGDRVSEAMRNHRAAIQNLMQAIGVWKGAV